MELKQRLRILRDAGQLSQKNYDAILNVIHMFDSKWGLKLTEENGSMFVTHLSIAAGRIEKGEPVGPVEESIYREVRENVNFGKCSEAFSDIEVILEIKIPESEKGYLMIYLCGLFENLQH